MQLIITGVKVSGTVEDLALLVRELSKAVPTSTVPLQTPQAFDAKDLQQMQDILAKSAGLRERLVKEPDYDPFSGVSQSSELAQVPYEKPINQPERPDPTAETGVKDEW